MKISKYFLLLLIISSACCQLVSDLEEESIKFEIKDLDRDILQKKIVKLAAIKDGSNYSIQSNSKNSFSTIKDKNVCGTIEYQKKLNETGWDLIYLQTNKSFSQEEQMQCAGFLEGIATKEAIDSFMFNISESRGSTPQQYKEYFTNVYNKLLKNEQESQNEDQKFWKTVYYQYYI